MAGLQDAELATAASACAANRAAAFFGSASNSSRGSKPPTETRASLYPSFAATRSLPHAGIDESVEKPYLHVNDGH